VPIIKCIGLGMGLLVWGLTNMLTGWASGVWFDGQFPPLKEDQVQIQSK
jgi:hypothetical protein